MIIVPDEKLRKYISYENGKWIYDPNMPLELISEFEKFRKECERRFNLDDKME